MDLPAKQTITLSKMKFSLESYKLSAVTKQTRLKFILDAPMFSAFHAFDKLDFLNSHIREDNRQSIERNHCAKCSRNTRGASFRGPWLTSSMRLMAIDWLSIFPPHLGILSEVLGTSSSTYANRIQCIGTAHPRTCITAYRIKVLELFSILMKVDFKITLSWAERTTRWTRSPNRIILVDNLRWHTLC